MAFRLFLVCLLEYSESHQRIFRRFRIKNTFIAIQSLVPYFLAIELCASCKVFSYTSYGIKWIVIGSAWSLYHMKFQWTQIGALPSKDAASFSMFFTQRMWRLAPAHKGLASMHTITQMELPNTMVKHRCCASTSSWSTRYPEIDTKEKVTIKVIMPKS